jgi:predicted outer membrane protein
MKKETFAAVATLATMMFMSQGTFAQDRSDQINRSGDTSSQPNQSQTDSSARQAGQSDRAGQRGLGSRAGQSGQSHNMDQKFVEFASTNDQFEIQAAQLAERNAQDDQIKQMARQIAQDHQQSSQKLQQAAQQAGIQVSQQLKPHQQAMLQELQQMQGQEFDRAWLYGNVAGHTKAVLKFRDEAREGQNEQIKQFAQQTLPTLQKHLQHAQEMAQFDTAQQAGATERATRPGDRSSDRPGSSTLDRSNSTDRSGASDRSTSGSSSSGRSGSGFDRGTPGSSSTGSGRGITDSNSDTQGDQPRRSTSGGQNR